MPRAHGEIPTLGVTPTQRHATGCIATFSNGESRHFVGSGLGAVRAAAAYCDHHGLRIATISTPTTIFRDMQGTRAGVRLGGAERDDGRESKADHVVHFPERALLTAIGRLDLWERRA